MVALELLGDIPDGGEEGEGGRKSAAEPGELEQSTRRRYRTYESGYRSLCVAIKHRQRTILALRRSERRQ